MMNQAQLKPATALKLKEALPSISDEDIVTMKKEPFRSFNPTILQEPMIYRFVEAMQHYGEGLKLLINERKGDGILSAIDIYVNLDIIKGTDLPYETKNPARTLQIDCIVFNKKKRTISSYEIKRGNGNFDAGKKRSIRNDILSTNFVLKGYGVSKKLDVKRAYSYIISYYGLRALPRPFSLIKEELDTHFGVSIVKQVEEVNNYFKAKLENVIQQNIK
jgi:hypothetical protein